MNLIYGTGVGYRGGTGADWVARPIVLEITAALAYKDTLKRGFSAIPPPNQVINPQYII